MPLLPIPNPHGHITGVYLWTNKIDGKVYVGGAYKSMKRRLGSYKETLPKGKCHNKHFQNAWFKYGRTAFSVRVIEWCPPDKGVEREDYWLRKLRAAEPEFGYNMCKRAGSRLGTPHSEETKEKIRQKKLGTKMSDEAKQKMSLYRTGRKMSETHRIQTKKYHWSKGQNVVGISAKIALGNTGRKRSEEHKANISAGIRRAKEAKARQGSGDKTLFD